MKKTSQNPLKQAREPFYREDEICPYYQTSDCDLRSCHHFKHPEHCYLYERAKRMNLENPERRATPNSIINLILDTLSSVEKNVVWEALNGE